MSALSVDADYLCSETENRLSGAESVNAAANGDLQAADTRFAFNQSKRDDVTKEVAGESQGV